jgi:bacterioferritin
MYVCFCSTVTDRAVIDAIDDGATTVEGVAGRCLAGSRCGGCRVTIEHLLAVRLAGTGSSSPERAGGEGDGQIDEDLRKVDFRDVDFGKEVSMAGDPGVIEFLNEVLTVELTAVNQYFLDAKMLSNWGYDLLAQRFQSDSVDEMKDAEVLIERVLFLGGLPNVQRLGPVTTGERPVEKLQLALQLERAAIERLNGGIALCAERSDGGSRLLLEAILRGEEGHADWLEGQLELVRQIGEPNYLAQQIR